MSDSDYKPTWKIFAAVIGVIVAGTSGWILLTIYTARATAPDEAKDLAKEFDRAVFLAGAPAEEFDKVCYKNVEDVETCKQLTGKHHRHCLGEARIRKPSEAGDDKNQYSEDKYIECMKEASDL